VERFFTREQANALIEVVEPMIHDGIALKVEYATAEGELRDVSRQIVMAGGSQVDQSRVLAIRERRDDAAVRLKAVLEAIQETGCQVKDLDVGLVDFPTLYRGTTVLLCWRLGEPRVEWWHGVDEGYPGRKPIDAEFLAEHGDGTSRAPRG
jgi:hypothetical protein